MQAIETDSRGSTHSSLLRRAAMHDGRAWQELVDLYGPLISKWCRRTGADWHMTADCIQEVFLVLAKRLDTFCPTGASGAFRAWLWRITKNKLIDLFRASNRQPLATGGSTAHLASQAVVSEQDWLRDEPTEPFGRHKLKLLTDREVKRRHRYINTGNTRFAHTNRSSIVGSNLAGRGIDSAGEEGLIEMRRCAGGVLH